MADEIQNQAEESPVVEEPAKASTSSEASTIKNSLEAIEKEIFAQQNNDNKFPIFNVGDTVRIYVKIKEGNKERLQPYEGVVMAFKHGGHRMTFTVRHVSFGVSTERVFPYHSPYLEKIEVVRRGSVRRAKLYYLRGRFGKAAKIKEKVNVSRKAK